MKSEKNYNKEIKKEEKIMDTTFSVKRIDKTNSSGLTLSKKKLLKSLQGIATSPIDFNKIRDKEKYGENSF